MSGAEPTEPGRGWGGLLRSCRPGGPLRQEGFRSAAPGLSGVRILMLWLLEASLLAQFKFSHEATFCFLSLGDIYHVLALLRYRYTDRSKHFPLNAL